MDSSRFRHYFPLALAIYIAVVFLQSLFFKFGNSFETQHIFNTIGTWMADLPILNVIAEPFSTWGGYTVGTVELIASGLLLYPRTRVWGALLALLVISGAIFFHLFTPLGVSVVINEAGDRDGGQLFALAVGVWIAAALLLYLHRDRFAQAARVQENPGSFADENQ